MNRSRIKNLIVSWSRGELFWLLVLSFTFRNIYQMLKPEVFYNFDTATYCYAALHIFDGAIDAFRTPVYPIIIKISRFINHENPFPNITIFQHIISFLSIIPFYLVCNQWMRTRFIVFVAALAYACLVPVVDYNNAFYPESLLVSSLVFLLYLFSRYLVQPTIFKSIFINIYVFYLVMLKPACVFLYVIFALIWLLKWIYERKSPFLKHAYIGFGISILLLFGYCLLNKKQNDFFGISSVSHDNNFANVILSNAYQDFSDPKLITIIDSIKYKGHYYAIYHLSNYCEILQKSLAAFPEVYPLNWNMEEVSHTPCNNYGYTAKNLAPRVKEAMLSKQYLGYIIDNFMGFSNTKVILLKGYIVYLLFFIEILLILYSMLCQRKMRWFLFFVFTMAAGVLVTVLVGGINDGTRDRVILPIAPFLVFMLFNLIDEVTSLLFKMISVKNEI